MKGVGQGPLGACVFPAWEFSQLEFVAPIRAPMLQDTRRRRLTIGEAHEFD